MPDDLDEKRETMRRVLDAMYGYAQPHHVDAALYAAGVPGVTSHVQPFATKPGWSPIPSSRLGAGDALEAHSDASNPPGQAK